jgi:hypothetical protein
MLFAEPRGFTGFELVRFVKYSLGKNENLLQAKCDQINYYNVDSCRLIPLFCHFESHKNDRGWGQRSN